MKIPIKIEGKGGTTDPEEKMPGRIINKVVPKDSTPPEKVKLLIILKLLSFLKFSQR